MAARKLNRNHGASLPHLPSLIHCRDFYRYASSRLHDAFPTLPDCSQFNRLVRRDLGLIEEIALHLANRHFERIGDLEEALVEALVERCVSLCDRPGVIRSYIRYHWWPNAA